MNFSKVSFLNRIFSTLFFFLVNLFFVTGLFSQKVSHTLSSDQQFKPRNYILNSDTIKILAVMVQFKPDKDTLTTGNGTFDLSTAHRGTINYSGKTITIDTIVDAPPHNRDYFYQHLVFLKNYYEKVSDKKVIINFTIIDRVYSLSREMKEYCPPKVTNKATQKEDYTKLANFVEESWRLVDSLNPEIDFSKYNSFFVFHAGTGADINLADIYGYDPSPNDLPSIYFGLKNLQKWMGSSYKGVTVNKGKYYIQNTAIIPECDYRELSTIGGKTLVQFSINGLIAANLGSYLGLPDLNNTQTGATAIGRFGLMDGQSFFSYNGLFPPEPSAWEKVYLGWVQPEVISSGTADISAYAHRTDGGDNSKYKIYKIPINSREYFLAECKYRDPGKNGQKISVWSNGNQMEHFLPRDTNGLFDQFQNVNLIKGVVTDVEDYDWSLPGGLADVKGDTINGGIIIWHIDENVIDSKMATNTINNDESHKGIDVEEADASQDIGQSYGWNYGSAVNSVNGWGLDLWYDDITPSLNRSETRPAYKNEFSPVSKPNNLAYDYSNSHIKISGFSAQNPVMTFKIKIGDDAVEMLPGYPKKFGTSSNEIKDLAAADLDGTNEEQLFFRYQNNLYGFNQKGKSILIDSSGLIVEGIYALSFADLRYLGKKQMIFYRQLTDDFNQNYFIAQSYFLLNSSGVNSFRPNYNLKDVRFGTDTVIPQVGFKENVPYLFNLVKSKGILFNSVFPNASTINEGSDTLFKPVETVNSFVIVDGIKNQPLDWFAIAKNKIKNNSSFIWLFGDYTQFKTGAGGDFNGDGNPDCALITYSKEQSEVNLLMFEKTSSSPGIKKLLSGICDNCWANISNPAVGDIDNDGKQDIVFTFSDKLYAYNFNGVLVPNFPVKINSSNPAITPVIGDINGDKKNEIIAISVEGKIFAVSGSGRQADGFPISIGIKAAVTPVLFRTNDNAGLAVISADGNLYAWKLKGAYDPNHMPWASENGNSRRTNYAYEELVKSGAGNELLPKSRAYNWPNPVYGGSTRIRFYLNENANVNIKIFDLSGEKVWETSTQGIGGIDNEVEWDVKNIQTGVYLGRIEANSSSGSSNTIIRIAVTK